MNKIIVRNPLKLKRKKYYVEYYPADQQRDWLVKLQLTYIEKDLSHSEIIQNLEEEFLYWVERYPTPLMATAFDHEGNVIHLKQEGSSLNGFKDCNTKKITMQWSCLRDNDFPQEQKTLE